MMANNTPFSVLISCYKNDNPTDLGTALDSVTKKQTVQPDEVILMVDGPVGIEMESMIKNVLCKDIPQLRPIWLPENKGLGNALMIGMQECRNELVARMDADDISVSDRFECQLRMFEEDPELSAASGHIVDFIGKPENALGTRKVPVGADACKEYIKKRDVVNHPAVMLRKSHVLKAGNYQDWYLNEDSYLWLRMYLNGCKFNNLDKVLVYMRSGEGQYARRGGWRYFKSEAGLQWLRLKNDVISLPRYIFNICVHFTVKVLMPNKIRGWFFQNILRK